MNSLKEIAQAIVKEMEGIQRECDPSAARNFRRIAVIDYSNALRKAPERSREENERWIRQAYEYRARAVECGANDDEIEESFCRLRVFYLPRLGKESPDAAKD